MRVSLYISFLIVIFLTSTSLADDPPAPTLNQVIAQLNETGTPYVILISTGGSGGYQLILVTTTPAGEITAEAGYNELGVAGGVIYGGMGMLLADYIDYWNLSADDSCQSNPTCFGSTASGPNGPV